MRFQEFYTEYQNLIATFPRRPNTIINSENSPYGDYIIGCRNVYWGFDSINDCEDCFYIYDAFVTKNCMDCAYTSCSELCYETLDGWECYNSAYLNACDRCTDCWYLNFCSDCQNCFGSFFLRSKQYCFFNKQLTKDEYEMRVKEYLQKDPDKTLEEVAELGKKFPKLPTCQLNNIDSHFGNYYYNNKSCYYLFDASKNEECAYIFDSHRNKNSFDQSYSAENELCYDMIDSIRCYQCFFSRELDGSTQCYFSQDLINCTNCFGCVYLKSKNYCILNKQYSPEEYKKIVEEIMATLPANFL